MHKLSDEIKTFYQNKENLTARQLLSYEYLEQVLEQNDLCDFNVKATKELDNLWAMAISYWIFPSNADITKIVDNCYLEKQGLEPEHIFNLDVVKEKKFEPYQRAILPWHDKCMSCGKEEVFNFAWVVDIDVSHDRLLCGNCPISKYANIQQT